MSEGEVVGVDVGVGDEDFAFHLVGIAEEERELAAEHGDDSIGGSISAAIRLD